MTTAMRRHVPKSLVVFVAGVTLFGAGLLLLHMNPYWQFDYKLGIRVIDHRAGFWSGIGHLVSAIGLLCAYASAAFALASVVSRQFNTRALYWALVVLVGCLSIAWLTIGGISEQYTASFHWDSHGGITEFAVVRQIDQLRVANAQIERPNLIWQALVRWQVEPDLNGYLRTGRILARTDGTSAVTVVRFVPIAAATALGSDGEVLRNLEREPQTR